MEKRFDAHEERLDRAENTINDSQKAIQDLQKQVGELSLAQERTTTAVTDNTRSIKARGPPK
eukprot:4625799-Amphidinium_carterae.1